MSQKAKKKRQQQAQTRLALARERLQQREQRQRTLALRAEKRWSNAQRQLAELGATVNEYQETVDGIEKTVYEVHLITAIPGHQMNWIEEQMSNGSDFWSDDQLWVGQFLWSFGTWLSISTSLI